jgi:hypothetical protein
MSRRLAVLIALAAAFVAAAPAAAVAAPAVLSTEQRPPAVAGWRGTVVWSSFDRADGRYHLMASREGGAPERLPVPPADGPFDVDLGTNATGSTYAVYSRCIEPGEEPDLPRTNCDLYRLALASGREEHLTGLSSPRWDEREPTIMRGQVAFVRRERHGGATKDVLRMGNTAPGAGNTRQLAQTVVDRTALLQPELTASHIAYVVRDPGPYEFGRERLQLRVLRTGRVRTVYTATSGGANAADITQPAATDSGRGFVFVRTNHGSGTGNRILRLDLSGDITMAQGTGYEISSSWAGNELGAVVGIDRSGTGTCFSDADDVPEQTECSVRLTGRLAFLRPF